MCTGIQTKNLTSVKYLGAELDVCLAGEKPWGGIFKKLITGSNFFTERTVSNSPCQEAPGYSSYPVLVAFGIEMSLKILIEVSCKLSRINLLISFKV